MKDVVLVFGGLGHPKSSVVTLYQDLLQALSNQYALIAIDPAVSAPAVLESSQFNFPYDARYSTFEQYLAHYSEQHDVTATPAHIAAALILTPVGSHLSIIKQLSASVNVDQLLFVVEKPSFSLSEVDEGFNNVLPELKRQGARFYFIDTALVSPSLQALFTCQSFIQELFTPNNSADHAFSISQLGMPEKIVAIACDNPADSIEALQQYRFDHRIELLNARQLLHPSKSGGAGFGFDMGIHAIAGLVRYLQLAGMSDAEVLFDYVTAEAMTHPKLERSLGAETHLYATGTITWPHPLHIDKPCLKSHPHSVQCCRLSLEAGKGGEIWDRRLELHFKDTVVAIGFGTLAHPPYLWRKDNNGTALRTFDVRGAGYAMHFNDILFALGVDCSPILTCEDSETLMSKSMNLLSALFDSLGDTLSEKERNISKKEQHSTPLLTPTQRVIRNMLAQVLDELVEQP
ncbi:hypothetical protein [Photobacterium swingsii]|uniref:hypothetical protein n=1 Tax=Photobacterium swingsii TaxID=680026 RepID=UPI004068F363